MGILSASHMISLARIRSCQRRKQTQKWLKDSRIRFSSNCKISNKLARYQNLDKYNMRRKKALRETCSAALW